MAPEGVVGQPAKGDLCFAEAARFHVQAKNGLYLDYCQPGRASRRKSRAISAFSLEAVGGFSEGDCWLMDSFKKNRRVSLGAGPERREGKRGGRRRAENPGGSRTGTATTLKGLPRAGTLSGFRGHLRGLPRVARGAQPWAGRWHPFRMLACSRTQAVSCFSASLR
jgi:hypothetical protein